MPVDLAAIIAHINDLATTVDSAATRERRYALETAWEELDSAEVNRRYVSAKTSFLLAQASGDYRRRESLTRVVTDYAVLAADGSFILPDRHSPARFYVLNTSRIAFGYGTEPFASIDATPAMYYRPEDLIVPEDPQRTPIDGTILGFRRAIEELRAVLDAEAVSDGRPAVALQDGTLVLWQLQGQTEPVRTWVLDQYLDMLDKFRERDLPIASYISSPGAAELMNMLRVSVCDYPDQGLTINCDHCRTQPGHVPACDILPNVPDRFLISEIANLQPGERTTIYHSRSQILNAYDRDGSGDQRICFFYMNAGREIARVEIPRWVAADLDKLELVHAVLYDQATLGRGYPVALQEAHEAAVLNMTDRRVIEQAVERALASAGIVTLATGKDGSKRGRFV